MALSALNIGKPRLSQRCGALKWMPPQSRCGEMSGKPRKIL